MQPDSDQLNVPDAFAKVLAALPPRECFVLEALLGVNDPQARAEKLAEVAGVFGMSEERVEAIFRQGMSRLHALKEIANEIDESARGKAASASSFVGTFQRITRSQGRERRSRPTTGSRRLAALASRGSPERPRRDADDPDLVRTEGVL